jgi:hypothetical protein
MWPVPEGGVIGKRRVRCLDGYEKASGKAIYSRDIYCPMIIGLIANIKPGAELFLTKTVELLKQRVPIATIVRLRMMIRDVETLAVWTVN